MELLLLLVVLLLLRLVLLLLLVLVLLLLVLRLHHIPVDLCWDLDHRLQMLCQLDNLSS
jgi:hypothetical protein